MFDIIVDVKVRLSSGATIELTEEQNKKIKNAALDVILGESLGSPDKKVKQVKKRAAYFVWTPEVDNELMSIVARFAYLKPKAKSREKIQAMKDFRMKYRISSTAMQSRIFKIKHGMMKKPIITGTYGAGGAQTYSRPTSLLG